LKSSIKLLIVM